MGYGFVYIDAVNLVVSWVGEVGWTQWIIAPDHRTVEVINELSGTLMAYLVKP